MYNMHIERIQLDSYTCTVNKIIFYYQTSCYLNLFCHARENYKVIIVTIIKLYCNDSVFFILYIYNIKN